MKIAHKLILLIAIGFFGCVGINIIGLSRINVINDGMRVVIDNTLPSFNALNEANIRFLEARIAIRSHVNEVSLEKKQLLENTFNEKIKAMSDALTAYEPLISDVQDRQLYMKAKFFADAYVKQSSIVLSYSNKNDKAGESTQLDILANQATQFSAAIADDVKYNYKLAKDIDVSSKENYEGAKWILFFSTLAITGFLAITGWLIYRQISRGLQAANSTISRIEDTLDFTLRAEVSGNDEISNMLKAFNQLISNMQNNLQELLQGAEQVSVSASQLQQSALKVSEGSGSQNTSTSHMAASVEEMTVSINHVADQAKTTSEQSNEVGRKAEAGQGVISHTVANIHAIAEAVDKAAEDIKQLEEKGREIESVINIIRAVAEQTNLLALNAAIEAARAGEQGRGFAVVADEVRTLAARTATSTKEIGDIISSIQNVSVSAVKRMQEATEKVVQGVEGAGQANETMEEICRVAAESVSLVADISHAIREQGAATNSIAQQVESVAQMVDENTQAANETANLANHLTKISGDMKTVVNAYRL
ncbi:methyl-accepting chemotaxis protein [uncultured Tolumonas sp.]|uniref:methyl-accepting chemotaxis protein n=1 Tax=uncultured Tolumonas sp. TaxID=263765 RepID=UPI002A0A6A33|nr:methyl-accepting chemotaxis protein [uncultured Tolumonas sp.]